MTGRRWIDYLRRMPFFEDQFSAVSWSGSDGDTPWLGEWEGGGSPSTGIPRVMADNESGVIDKPEPYQAILGGVQRISRPIDLTGAVTAEFEIDYRWFSTPVSPTGAELQHSTDGETWQTLYELSRNPSATYELLTVALPVDASHIGLVSLVNYLWVNRVTVRFTEQVQPEGDQARTIEFTARIPTSGFEASSSQASDFRAGGAAEFNFSSTVV